MASQIGRYRVLELASKTPSSSLYLAEDPTLGRRVWLQWIDRTSQNGAPLAEIRAFAQSLASLEHPHVCRVYALEEHEENELGSGFVIAMEAAEHEPLAERLRRARVQGEDALELARQIAAGLEALHARGLSHGSLWPAGICVSPDGWVSLVFAGPGLEAGLSRTRSLGADGSELADDLDALRDLLRSHLSDAFDAVLFPVERNRETAARLRRALDDELLRRRARALANPQESSEERWVHLPSAPSKFVGRAAVLAELRIALGESRLLTICAPGGAGKTRTAIETLRTLGRRFPDGVWFVDLSLLSADGSDADAVAALILRTLRWSAPSAENEPEAFLARSIGARRICFLLDNCEHVLAPAAASAARLLAHCPNLTLLATSHEPLHLPGELIVSLPCLELPAAGASSAEARGQESVRLFEDRFLARSGSGALDDRAYEQIAEICRGLDGLPLAIELAASQSRSLSLAEIVDRVREAPLALAPLRGAGDRHRSLEGLVEWGYRLLSDPEQRLLQQLSLFQGGWRLASAEEICAGIGIERWQVSSLLGRLVECSLVQVAGLKPNRPVRFRLLEIVRGFARVRLEAGGAAPRADLERRFVEHFAELADTGASPFASSGEYERLQLIEAEYDNLVAALSLAVSAEDVPRSFALGAGIARYWMLSGQWRTAMSWIRRILALRGPRPSAPQLVELFGVGARLATQLQDEALASDWSTEMLALARASDDARVLLRGLHFAGVEAWSRVRTDLAESLFLEGEALARRVEDRERLLPFVANLGAVRAYRGDLDGATARFREQLELGRSLGEPHAVATALSNLGRVAQVAGRTSEAMPLLEEALAAYREITDTLGIATCLHSIGDTALILGHLGRASEALAESLELRLEMGQQTGLCSVLRSAFRLAGEEGNPDEAAEILGAVVRAREHDPLLFDDQEGRRLEAQAEQLVSIFGRGAFEAGRRRGEERSLEDLVRWLLSRRRQGRSWSSATRRSSATRFETSHG